MMVDVKLPYCLDKGALVNYVSEDGENIHVSWKLDDKVVAFEFTSYNHPALLVWESEDEYKEAIKDCDWIISTVDVMQCISCHKIEFTQKAEGWNGDIAESFCPECRL